MINKKSQVAIAIVWTVVIIAILIIGTILFFTGIPIKTTSDGSHTGYVSAIEKNGIWYKDYTVYFKTNPTSAQEDTYCLYITDTDLLNILQQAEDNQTKITITFDDYLVKSSANCNGEGAIITGIK